jgi:hypothetical protein
VHIDWSYDTFPNNLGGVLHWIGLDLGICIEGRRNFDTEGGKVPSSGTRDSSIIRFGSWELHLYGNFDGLGRTQICHCRTLYLILSNGHEYFLGARQV